MKSYIYVIRKQTKRLVNVLAMLLIFQIITFSISGQTTFINNIENSQPEYVDQHGNVKQLFNNVQQNVIQVQHRQSNGTLWQSIGPIGGDINDISICPDSSSIIFATGTSPYISIDGGSNWSIIEPLSEISSFFYEFSICALPNGKIIAGGGSLYGSYLISDNYGKSWIEKDLPANSSNGQICVIIDIEFDPTNPNIVFFGTSSAYENTKSEVLYKSTDGGNTFNIIETDILDPEAPIRDISIDPMNSDIIFAVSSGGFTSSAVIVSSDGGENWVDCSSGLNTQWLINSVSVYNGITYLGGGQPYANQFFGLHKSTDYGQSWQDISSNFPSKMINDVVISTANPNVIYAATIGDGIYKGDFY